MFVRSDAGNTTSQRVHSRAAEGVREELAAADGSETYLGRQGRKTEDIRSANPLRLLARAAVPLVVAFLALALVIEGIPTTPDIQMIAAKALPAAAYPSGTIIAAADTPTNSGDHKVQVASGDKTTLIVWDYAVEDGDMVSVLIDGQPLSDSFVIRHAPRVITVPANSRIQVVGTFDGGGGITYAVSFPAANSTIFNGISSGKANTYLVESASAGQGVAR
jgi:hypothetical protein